MRREVLVLIHINMIGIRRLIDMDKITKDMIIGEVIAEHPELVRTFFANGMMCIGCPASQGESIEQAATVHGLDGEALVNALNEALNA